LRRDAFWAGFFDEARGDFFGAVDGGKSCVGKVRSVFPLVRMVLPIFLLLKEADGLGRRDRHDGRGD
jgi:hypothetical protein